MRFTLALCFGLLANAATAQNHLLPDLFSVTGVAANDKLNIRSHPSTTSDVVGKISPKANNVEVVAQTEDGKWSKVNSGESSGWVSSKFLTLQSGTWKQGALPTGMICSGTEPFWSVDTRNGKISFRPMDGKALELEQAKILDRNFEGDRNRVIIANAGDQTVTAVIQQNQCSDGMSDRSFGLSSTFVFQGGNDGANVLYGCCSIGR